MISVIVPVYNVENYIRRCVESVLSQSYSDWELLLIDDGSTDLSGKICGEYAAKDSRIICIHKDNGGQASARNVGLKEAKGNYIAFLDSDDWLSESFLQVCLNEMLDNDADIVTANYYMFFDKNNCKPIFNVNKKHEVCNNPQAMKRLLDNNGTSSSVCARLYKSEIIKDIRFQEGMLFEDAAISYRIFLNADKVVFLSEPLMFYFQREGSTMSRRDKKIRLDEIRAAHERYVAVRKLYDDDISTSAFADYVFDMIHVSECFIRDGYNLSELENYNLFLRKELKEFKYRYWINFTLRKKIEAVLWFKLPTFFYICVKVLLIVMNY